MADLAAIPKWFHVDGVNMKTTGTVSIISARAKRLLVAQIFIVTRTRTGSGSGATLSFGSNSTSFDNVVGGVGGSLTNQTAIGGVNFVITVALPTSEYREFCDLTTSGFKLNITTGSTYTTETADIWVEGTLV